MAIAARPAVTYTSGMPEPSRAAAREHRRSLRSALLDGLEAIVGRIYDAICGTHPNVRCLHFQWLAVRVLYRDLRDILAGIRGRVLDVGCGGKPYAPWLRQAEKDRIVGIDVVPGPGVDVVVSEGGRWPFPDGSFDAVLCTQVLEHVADVGGMLEEIHRVLAPSGTVIASVPFLYPEHGAPRDFHRFSRHGIVRRFTARFEIAEARTEGGFGSTACMLGLAWLHTAWNRRFPTRVVKLPLLPAWLAATLALNGLGLLLDRLDGTGAFYSNVILVARKRATST